MTSVILFISLLILVIVGGSVYSSIRIVEEGELEAVVVFGKMEGVLEPGLNIVPPLISKTYPIDPRTMTMDRGDTRVEIPAEFETEVREAATGPRERNAVDGTGRRVQTGADSSNGEPPR